jgi:nitrite reductase/ring-hydroxylating ferredoxin subunit
MRAAMRCRRGKAGWICPHKGIALGSVPAVDGVITCPGHGLRICAASGEVLGDP